MRPVLRLSWLLCLVLLASGLGACATPRVVGRVLDDDRAPVVGASVSTEPATDLLVTNQVGVFRIERVLGVDGEVHAVPKGRYVLRVKKLGHRDLAHPFVYDGGALMLGDLVLPAKKLDVDASGDVTPNRGTTPVGNELTGGVYPGE